jgi:catechol 2,3-dioxygenase-like lactoylglutathione lyase family enzyme
MAPSPKAVLESSLYVSDLTRAIAFYQDVLGLRKMDEFPGGRGAAFQVGAGPSVLLLFDAELTLKGGLFPLHGASGPGHVALRVEADEMDSWRKRLQEHGVTIERELTFRNSPPSLYFRDPDNNSIELAVATIWPLENSEAERP